MPAHDGHDDRLRRVVEFYEGIAPANLGRIDEVYAADARFKDPFNEVQGRQAIRAIFAHMFTQVHAPRFRVQQAVSQGDIGFITWTMAYKGRADATTESEIRGCTELQFDAAGLIVWHRDYWDAAEELYEKQPLLGALMRAIKRRLSA